MNLVINVEGGIASLESDLPQGITLEINDYDNESKEEYVTTNYLPDDNAEYHLEAFEAGKEEILSGLRSIGYPQLAEHLRCPQNEKLAKDLR